MNLVVLHGRLTKEPELIFAAGSGTAICKFGLAVNRIKKGEADFLNIVAFSKNAETIAQYFQKGSPILVHGHIQTGSYDAQDGSKRYTTDIIVDRFDFISNKKDGQGQQQNTGFDDDMTPVDDGDMPF